jgi:hypothetical protein
MPLRVAAARNRFDWFPAPSCEQALRPAPAKNVIGIPTTVDHASAAYDEKLLARITIRTYLFFCSLGSRFSVLGSLAVLYYRFMKNRLSVLGVTCTL